MFMCQRLHGKTWGLKPKIIYWSYSAIIKPMVTYASLAWWPKTLQVKTQELLNKIYRLACLGITGAMKTCPTAAMGAMLSLTPLHLAVQKEAMLSALRLPQISDFKIGDFTGHLKITE